MTSHRVGRDALPLLEFWALPRRCNTDQKAESTSLGSLNCAFLVLCKVMQPLPDLEHAEDGSWGIFHVMQLREGINSSKLRHICPAEHSCTFYMLAGMSIIPCHELLQETKKQLVSLLVKLSELPPSWAETSPSECTRRKTLHSGNKGRQQGM